jgi:ribosome biogenesis GTPase
LTSPTATQGRVVAIGGGLAAVRVDGVERIAKLAGRLRRTMSPVAGDAVEVTLMDDGTARIDTIHPRQTRLVREQRLGRGDQTLVANAEVLVIVAAIADPPLRRGLLDRLLVAAWAGGMDGAIVITKVDREADAAEPAARVLADYRTAGYEGVAVDARTVGGTAAVRALIGGRLAAVVGHSGVGKSTLVNGLTGRLQATGAVNEVIGRGRHTTTTARLLHGQGIEIIDTPGIRGFALAGLDELDLGAAFPEIAEASARCRFRGCLHLEEPACAVRDAVAPARFESYRKLLDELRGIAPVPDGAGDER